MDPSPPVIGRYELHRALASGGMATVHLGRMRSDTGHGRTVALKRIHPHFARDPSFVEMFFDEARLAMRVQHHNIVPTFDVVTADAELLLVMEYIHGESLADLARAARGAGARVPPAIASSILCGVLAGLHAAHEARSEDGAPLEIIHRDVSPQNILVGVDGCARLLDFGIAKAAGRVHTTQNGLVKGKFAYMAPEQLTSIDEVDRRADVFAAAVVLWEALTGARLFRGDTPGALVSAVLSAEIAPPSTLVRELSPAVDAVVMRGLARQRRERFDTAQEMAMALEAALPPATLRAVGAWVEARASAALSKRALLVKEVETAGAVPRAAESEAQAAIVTRMEAVSGRDELPSEAFGERAPAMAPVAKPARRRLLGIASVIALLVATAALGARTIATSASTRGAAVTIPLSESVAPRAPPSIEPARALDTAPVAAPPVPIASAPASSFPPLASSSPSPSTSAAPLAPIRRPRPLGAKPNCSNPFVVDPRGIRVPRPECF